MSNLSGKQLGPYTIEDRIALGGMAAIYRARQPSTGREVAVKVLPLNLANDPKLVARFEREAQVLASLQHPHILPLFDFGREGEWIYFVTPLIPHGDLGEYLTRYGEALPLPEIRRIFLQLTDALDCAHNGGIVHRDLKPANVLMDARGNCLLSDFGIAKMEGTAALTNVGTALGTPEYMSPEQGTGKAVDARSDIYALGIILYELATGHVPFRANTATELLLKQVEQAPRPPRELNADIPDALQDVILKALAKRPEERYQSAAALGGAVAAAIPERARPTATTVENPLNPGAATVLAPLPVTPVNTAAAAAADAPTVVVRPASNRAPLVVIGLAGAVLVGVGAWLALRPKATPPPATPATPATTSTAATPPLPLPKPPPPPPPPSPAPARASDVFDDFANPGAPEAARWTPIPGAKSTRLEQRDGVLLLSTREQLKGLFTPLAAGLPTRVSARLRMLAPAQTGSIGITLSQYAEGALQPSWWATCYLGRQQGAAQATPTCTDIGYQKSPVAAPVALGSWHELALEPAGQRVRVSVDGVSIGELPLPHDASDPNAHWFVSLTGWSQDGAPVEGEFDDVVID